MPVTTFGDLTVRYDGRVLSPRAWTVRQSEWVAAAAADLPAGPVLELCSGAGHIGLLALSLLRRSGGDRSLVCVDVAPAAAELATANAAAAGLAPYVEVRCADLSAALAPEERFPLVVVDPPWVPTGQTGRYPEDPLLAIDGGDDGLDVARRCLVVVGQHLAPGGAAVLQLGYEEQVEALASDLAGAGLVAAEVRTGERGVLVRLVGSSAQRGPGPAV